MRVRTPIMRQIEPLNHPPPRLLYADCGYAIVAFPLIDAALAIGTMAVIALLSSWFIWLYLGLVTT